MGQHKTDSERRQMLFGLLYSLSVHKGIERPAQKIRVAISCSAELRHRGLTCATVAALEMLCVFLTRRVMKHSLKAFQMPPPCLRLKFRLHLAVASACPTQAGCSLQVCLQVTSPSSSPRELRTTQHISNACQLLGGFISISSGKCWEALLSHAAYSPVLEHHLKYLFSKCFL